MTRVALLAATLVLAALLALTVAFPAAASAPGREPVPAVRVWRPLPEGEPTGGHGSEPAGPSKEVLGPVLYTLAGVAAGCVVFGGLYLVKRGLGGFPPNPAWKAPITVMSSKDSPVEGSYGDAPADAHGAHH